MCQVHTLLGGTAPNPCFQTINSLAASTAWVIPCWQASLIPVLVHMFHFSFFKCYLANSNLALNTHYYHLHNSWTQWFFFWHLMWLSMWYISRKWHHQSISQSTPSRVNRLHLLKKIPFFTQFYHQRLVTSIMRWYAELLSYVIRCLQDTWKCTMMVGTPHHIRGKKSQYSWNYADGSEESLE